jgi:plasmid maintenance system antidote protein VapI
MDSKETEVLRRTITQRDKTISRKLKSLWDTKKRVLELSQQEMADRLGITQSAFSQMLHARMVITTDQIIKIALVFKESPTLIDPTFYTRFDIHNKNDLKTFLSLEIARMSEADRKELLPDNVKGRKRKAN